VDSPGTWAKQGVSGHGIAVADDANAFMITRGQAVACLEILGLQGPAPSPDELSRAEALGHLLFLAEAAALADSDRLDQEALRAGYSTAAHMVVTGSMGIEDDAGVLVTLQLLSRLVEDRMRRTRLDLADLETPLGAEGGWSPFRAIDAALDGVLALLARPAPPFVFDQSAPFEVRAMRDAIAAAETGVRTSLYRLVGGIRTVERLAQA
jgi:hypothetical protein